MQEDSGNIILGDLMNTSDLGFKKAGNIPANRYTNESADIRSILMEYFSNEESVSGS